MLNCRSFIPITISRLIRWIDVARRNSTTHRHQGKGRKKLAYRKGFINHHILCSILHHILFFWVWSCASEKYPLSYFGSRGWNTSHLLSLNGICHCHLAAPVLQAVSKVDIILDSRWTWCVFSRQNIQQEALILIVRCLVSSSEFTAPVPIVTSGSNTR